MSQRDAARGCLLALFLFVAALNLGWMVAEKHGVNRWAGLGLGASAWLALHSGLMCFLSLLFWRERRRTPRRVNGPDMFLVEGRSVWFVWAVFVASLTACLMMLKWMGVVRA